MHQRQDLPHGLDLEGKIFLVTGASRGVGAAVVRAARAQGAEVVLHYGRNRERAEALARECGAAHCRLAGEDLADPAAARRLWRKALEWRGRVDVLVNNAAVYEAVALDADEAAWDAAMARTLQVNLLAPAALMRAALAHFAPGSGGILINIESRAAFRGDGAVYAPYAASKGALMSFGRTVARARAADGVLVYGISPGWVDTDMAAAGIEALGREYVMRDIPIGDIVPPAEIANLAVFLAAGRARHATGTSIDINGASYPR